jgi:uncharacterized FlaG/YvyC family protein
MSLTIDKGVVPGAYDNMVASGITRADTDVKVNDTDSVRPVAQSNPAELEKVKDPVKQPEAKTSKHKDAITLTYDNLADVTVIKSFDSKGNVVTQLPPAQLLKSMELEGKQDEVGKGQIINKKE